MEINKVMGPTAPPMVQGTKSILDYPGIKFIFAENTLAKLQIFSDENLPDSIAKSLCSKKCRVLLNHGLQFYFDNDLGSLQKRIFFGQPMPEVLDTLGTPNKEYHKVGQNCLFLNYFELGIDVMIETQDYSVKKLVVHCNNPLMHDFCFYDRCYFEMQL